MGLFEHWPYVNFHDLNLDWIIKEIPKVYASRDEAQASAEASAESAAASQQSAEAALASQEAAHQSELNAAQSEENAADSEANAKNYADHIADPVSGLVTDWLEDNITPTTPAVDASLTVAGAAADAKVTGDKITDLNNAVNSLSETSYLVTVEKGETANSSGILIPFRAENGDRITASTIDETTFGSVQLRFYDANRQYLGHWALGSGYGSSRSFTYNVENPAYYVGITTVDVTSPEKYNVINNSNRYKQVTDLLNDAVYNIEIDKLDRSYINVLNRFDKDAITPGVYLSTTNGATIENTNFFASDYIYIKDIESVKCSYTHIVCFYTEKHVFISGQNFNTGSADGVISKPQNAVYMRFSSYNSDLNSAQIGKNVNRNNYVKYGMYSMPDLQIKQSQISYDEIIVDASGAGDYTSFTLAVKENIDNNKTITVMPGTYDIVSEYVDIWGSSAVNNMSDADSSIFEGFQYGVIIRNRKIDFKPGSHIVCDWTGHTVDGTHRFSALRVDYDAEIVGLYLECTAAFYAIHDDYGLTDKPYTVKYENCIVKGHNLVNANCIGGGCKKWSTHILDNCYFDNELTGSATVRYHNTNAAGAEPEIYVKNCFFNNWFTPRWYGSQTTKMKVYVNNCMARSIHKMAESSSFNVDNVELLKWCNTETDPQ